MDAPLQQLTNQPQINKSRRPQALLPGHSPPLATVLTQPFTEIWLSIPEPFNEHFSLLPLRDELHFRMTCRDLYSPWDKSFQNLRWSFKPETPFEQANCLNLRLALCYFAVHEPQQLNERYLGEYTLQQLQEGNLTSKNAKKLNDFLDKYQKENFTSTNKDENVAWIEEQLNQDATLAHYFSPAHSCWPEFITPETCLSALDLELALLLNSAGVQKYAGNDLAGFCESINNESTSSTDSDLAWMDEIKQRLNLFNDPVIQTYLDEEKITVEKLIRHSRASRDGLCLDENLKSPLIKRYFDEGFFGNPSGRGAIDKVIQRCYMSENLSFLLHSPVIRTAYETGTITGENIKALSADKPFCPGNILEYLIGHILKDEKSQLLAGKFLNYFEQKLKGLESWQRLPPLTEKQKSDLAMKGVKEAIIDDKLTMADVLERSMKFCGWRVNSWLR